MHEESLWPIASQKCKYLLAYRVPVFISSWIRNTKPAQRISIIWSDGAAPAEVLLSEETPTWDQAFYGHGEEKLQGPKLEASSCCRAVMSLYAFHMLP